MTVNITRCNINILNDLPCDCTVVYMKGNDVALGYLFIVSAQLDGIGDETSCLFLGHGADVLQSNHQLDSKEQMLSLQRLMITHQSISSEIKQYIFYVLILSPCITFSVISC